MGVRTAGRTTATTRDRSMAMDETNNGDARRRIWRDLVGKRGVARAFVRGRDLL